MAGFYLPTNTFGQGLGIRLGDFNGDGKFDVSVGLQNYRAYGNGAYGGYDSNEIGFSTAGGAYVSGDSGRYTPFASERSQWGANAYGSASNYSYGDVFGNYQNHRYAQDVFGNYGQGHTYGNPWGVSDHQYSGNAWTGAGWQSHRYADAFGNCGGWGAPSFPRGCYGAGGGLQVGAWFGF